ncbi:MAG: hypothetical protein ACT4OT_17235 [Acidobacteriota bacterium]
MEKLIALHKHWLAADAVKQFLFSAVPIGDKMSGVPKELIEVAQVWSGMLRLEVFYGLMYVVVEGFQSLGYHDQAVDELLAKEEYLDAFRRFRNAVFHYQGELVSPKLVEFLDTEGSETWTNNLYAALKSFFETNLPIEEFINGLQTTDAEQIVGRERN